MKLLPAGVLLALCIATGCASPPPPPPPVPPPQPVIMEDMTDGLYRGTSTRYQADSRTCPSPGLVTLRVAGAQFTYRWNANTEVSASIQADGSVQGQFGDVTLNGQVTLPQASPGGGVPTPQRIEGDVSNGICSIHYTVFKRG